MGFQLVIAEGKEVGREFFFEQDSVLIGRVSDCDIVLYDPGVSRRHARIFSEGRRYFVEDMGSSNGTLVNGEPVRRHALSDGDLLALGSVVFNFSAVEIEDEPAPTPGVERQETRIVSRAQVRREKPTVSQIPDDVGGDELQALSRSQTLSAQAVARPPAERPQARGLSAAERARIRRESSKLVAALRIFWADASAGARTAIVAVVAMLVLAPVVAGVRAFLNAREAGPKLPPEPSALTAAAVEYSFGLGKDVDYPRPDQKTFEFEYNSPVQAAVLLHFQARDIDPGEVTVTVNGTSVGSVPPDTSDVEERLNELLVPAAALKKGEKNWVQFDSVRNPPGSDPWRVWNVWVELVVLPVLDSPEQLKREAAGTFEYAQKLFERRGIGAENAYKAWKAFRKVWLMLEAMPDADPKLHRLARDKMKEAQAVLDGQCRKILVDAFAAHNLHDDETARNVLSEVERYFPDARDQSCPRRVERLRAQWL